MTLENSDHIFPRERLARRSHLEVGLSLLLPTMEVFLLAVSEFIVPTLPFLRRITRGKYTSIALSNKGDVMLISGVCARV